MVLTTIPTFGSDLSLESSITSPVLRALLLAGSSGGDPAADRSIKDINSNDIKITFI